MRGKSGSTRTNIAGAATLLLVLVLGIAPVAAQEDAAEDGASEATESQESTHITVATGDIVFRGDAALPRFPCEPPPPFGNGPCQGDFTGEWTGELVGTARADGDPEPFQATWTSGPGGLSAEFIYAEWDCQEDLATVLGIAQGEGTAISGPGQVDGRWIVPGEAFPRAINAVALDFEFTWTRVLTGAVISISPTALRMDVSGLGWQTVVTDDQRALATFVPQQSGGTPHVPTCDDPLTNVTGTISGTVPIANS